LGCDSCKTVFIDPFPIDKINEIYPSNYYSFINIKKNFVTSIKEYLDKRLFKRVISKNKNETIKVLDIGGGSGWLLDLIKSLDSRVQFTQVVDIDTNAKEIAENNGHNYYQGTIETFETNEKFDIVLMLNLIEHISNPKDTLVKIDKLLNHEGVVLIKTPNIESYDARLFRNSYWGGLHCPRHWILFSQNSFRHILSDINLSIQQIKYTQGAPFWAWSVLINLQKKGLAKIDKQRPVIFHPIIPLLHIIFAGFDFFRSFFGIKTSQMFIELKKQG